MQRVVQYVAEDGTPFEDPDSCAEYDRKTRFSEALVTFITNNFPDSTSEDLHKMDKLWDIVFDKPEEFQPVLDAAKPKPRRGRPRTKKKKNLAKKEAVKQTPTPAAPKKRKQIFTTSLLAQPSKTDWRKQFAEDKE